MNQEQDKIFKEGIVKEATAAFSQIIKAIPDRSHEFLSILAEQDQEKVIDEIRSFTDVYRDIDQVSSNTLVLIGAMVLISNTPYKDMLLEKIKN